jgi:hypothetical protein
LLQDQIGKKDDEISKIRQKSSGVSSEEKTKLELKRSHTILK